MREKKMRKHRILAFLMAFLMIFTMIPTTAFAASDDTESSSYAVTFYGHSAQLNSYKLYTYENGTKGETDLLNGVEGVSGSYNYYMNTSYTTELPAGDYWLEGYDSNADYNGGIVVTVDEAEEFYVLRAYGIYASNSGWVLGTDYELSAEVTNTDKTVNRQAEIGSATTYGTTAYASCICLYGDTIKVTYTPIGERTELCMETFKSKTMTGNDMSWSQKIPECINLTFIVPEGSEVSTGKFHTYYIYDFVEPTAEGSYGELTPDDTSDDDDTREYATFKISKESVNLSSGPYFFYRVQNEKGVTYWDFYDPTKLTETTIEITEEQLFIDSEDFNSESIYRFDYNTYDSANIYMNVNAQGYMNLEKGDEFELNVFRNWMAIENFYNRRVALPDMEYKVINLEGDAVISITPDENNSCVANIEAVGEGTAIVLVTYDAMFSNCAYVSGTPYQPNRFSAIWPENTGVFVVSVGADGTSIDTNMEMDRLGSTGNLDAEHDILFYVDDDGTDDGTSYTFTPESDCTVTVNRSTVTDTEMNFATEFTSDRVVTAADGSVTVSGLTTGRHIIKVEKGDVAAYQVISVRKVSYELQDENGNKLTEEDEIKAGDNVYIQFSGLVNPNEKMSGVYNHSAVIRYIGEDETTYTSLPGGAYGVYDFSGNPERQKIAIEIPKYWDGDSYSLHGAIKMNVSGDAAGKHRNVTYAKGVNANYGAESSGTILSSLPDINIALDETEFLTGTLSFADNDEKTVDISDIAQISMSDTDGNVINVREDGTFVCVPGDYYYEIYAAGYMYKTGTVTVAEGDTAPSFTIELEKSSEGAWDGVTMNVPETDEEGIYLISTGAELAWFVNESITSAVSGKLTADIDLAGYEWKYNTSTNTTNAIVLDGNDKEITNLYSTTAGLFGYLGTGSSVSNLTIRGEINSTKQTIGAITSYLYGENSVIENCVSYVNITSTQGYLGGIAGSCSGIIKNCANYGNIQTTGTSSAVAGIVASPSKGAKIENCFNAGKITGATMAGGIVGYIGNYEVVVTGCYNTGAITGSGNYVGGIAGYMIGGNGYVWQGGAATMEGCYNTGTVSGAQYVGGLVGNIGTANVSDCYNAGTVTGTSNVGGAVGRILDTKVTADRCYYLTRTAESDAGAVALTESELKVAELSADYFGGTCNGYPALLWQTDATFHTSSENGIVTNPTCTEKGYTAYTCSNCTESYRDNYTDALGHDWCECTEENPDCTDCEYTAPTCTETGSIVHTCKREGCTETKTDTVNELGHDWCKCTEENAECTDCEYTAPTCTETGSIVRTCRRDNCTETTTDVIPANGHTEDESQTVVAALYKDCVCSICDVSYRVWNDSRIQYMSLDDTIVSDITLTDNGNYPWVYNETRQRFESSCNSVNNGSSETTVSITLTGTGIVSFDYGVSSEANFDKLTIAANIGETTVTIANAISGTQSNSFEQELEAGTYSLTFTYKKDGSSNSGDDCGWISNLKIEASEIPVVLPPIVITVGDEDFEVTSLGERTYKSSSWKDEYTKPIYTAKVPENTEFVINQSETGDGASGTNRNFAMASGMSYDGSYPFTMTTAYLEQYVLDAAEFIERVGDDTGLNTENRVAFIEVKDSSYERLYVLLVELTPVETPAPAEYTVTLPEGEGYTVEAVEGFDSPIEEGGSYSFIVTIADDYEKGTEYAVKANDVTLEEIDGKYTISNIEEDQEISVTGVVKKTIVPEEPVEPVSVYFSVSHDADYVAGDKSGEIMALKEIEVPYFDLEEYGLGDFEYESEEGSITMLHLFLYATEVYYCGVDIDEAGQGYLYDEGILGTDVLNIGGSAGSMFLDNFWALGYNLNYYLNYEYPLASSGWGATADQIILEDDDIVTLGVFTSWSFYSDPASIFNFIKAGEDVINTTAKQGDKVNMTLYHAGSDITGSGTTAHTALTSTPEVYYTLISELENGIVSTWTSLGQADENGNITVDTRNLLPGEYLIAIAGQYGSTYTDEICSAPGGIILTVTENPELPPVVEEENEIIRISGTTRYETGYKVADALKAELGVDKFDAVVIATGKNFADALSGSYLAVVKNAPIILTNGKDDNVAQLHEYITSNVTSGGTVYILGGEAAVPESVEVLEGYTVKRLSGTTRYETNLEILKEAGYTGGDIIVATGKNFADSLSASAVQKPILLVKPGSALSADQKAVVEAVEDGTIYIVGGTGAVDETMESELSALGTVERVFGTTRQETSVAIAEKFFADAKTVIVANARNFPDGLCGGPLAAAMNAPLILTTDGKTAAAESYVAAEGIISGIVLGGTGALADESVVEVFALESTDEIIVK